MAIRTILLIFLVYFLTSCAGTKTNTQSLQNNGTHKAKNIILIIGDGMGLTQISAGTFSNNNKSNFERFKSIGIHKPYASESLITDSAAAATSFACGIKTYNHAIGVDTDTMAVETILEEAEKKGLATGLIATSSIYHATPASFIAHNKTRLDSAGIALDFLKTDLDLFIGGGKKQFANRDDEQNLVADLEKKGYVIKDFIKDDIKKLKIDPANNFGFFTANEEPLPFSQGRDYLVDASVKGVEFLNKRAGENGFFLMIEGSQIDWGGHANKTEYVISEWKEFNEMIGKVLDWAEKDGNTLVIITADHETGGLAIQQESEMNNIVGAFTSGYHTGAMIPVFAKGPGEEYFRGIYENTEIYFSMRKAFGWKKK